MRLSHSEFILGGQKSGKSARAETLAQQWLGLHPAHTACLVATGQAWDGEMQARIARHQRDRAERVPGMATLEEPVHVAEALQRRSAPHCLLVLDCLTLWLTNRMMPLHGPVPDMTALEQEIMKLTQTLKQLSGPVVVVGNEIGLGVVPLGPEVRAFVDQLGRLNQRVAAVCQRVTLMAAGLPLTLKGEP